MKRSSARLAAIAVALQCAAATAAAAPPRAEELLRKLFPAASLQHARAGAIVSPVSLRGRHGVIRLADARVQPFGAGYVALAFEVLLTSEQDVRRWVESAASGDPPGAMKLLQVIVFDARTGDLLGKPDGFPLEGDGWTCKGDACSVLRLLDLTAGVNGEPYVVLTYSSGVDGQLLRVVAVGAGRAPVASPAMPTGDLSGESGCRVTVSYGSLALKGGSVVGVRQSDCDPGCPDICKTNGLPPGESRTGVRLLPLGVRR